MEEGGREERKGGADGRSGLEGRGSWRNWEVEGKGRRGEGTIPVDDEGRVVAAVRVGEVGVDVVFAWVGHGDGLFWIGLLEYSLFFASGSLSFQLETKSICQRSREE